MTWPLFANRSVWVWLVCLFFLSSSLHGQPDGQESATDRPVPPEWVADAIAGRPDATGKAWVSEPCETARMATEELQRRVLADVVRWCRSRIADDKLDLARLDWPLVRSFLDEGSYWVGIEPGSTGENQWRSAARLELNEQLLVSISRSLETRTRLKRIEQLFLVIMAATGTVVIVWMFLLLDHKTRHHFSRRFQTLAVIAWVTMGVAIAAIWWWALL